jgi:hypothetical protein
MGGVVKKKPIPSTISFGRKENDQVVHKNVRRLLNVPILNCMIICCANSGQSKMYHFKFRVALVLAVLTEHGSETERKEQGHHPTAKNVPRPLKRHFPKRIPHTQKKARPTKRCVVCYKHNSVLVP